MSHACRFFGEHVRDQKVSAAKKVLHRLFPCMAYQCNNKLGFDGGDDDDDVFLLPAHSYAGKDLF